MTNQLYRIYAAIVAPTILSATAIVAAIVYSWWFLAAIPFVWLGSICSAPNMNLADGCAAYFSMIIGFGLMSVAKPLGLAILIGAASGFFASALEKRIRMRPVEDG